MSSCIEPTKCERCEGDNNKPAYWRRRAEAWLCFNCFRDVLFEQRKERTARGLQEQPHD